MNESNSRPVLARTQPSEPGLEPEPEFVMLVLQRLSASAILSKIPQIFNSVLELSCTRNSDAPLVQSHALFPFGPPLRLAKVKKPHRITTLTFSLIRSSHALAHLLWSISWPVATLSHCSFR